ncbi:MAG TPA: SRPBCC family protein [Polyangiales bacterium]|nr:SRPBCC family protein [Polyangiales bacterium]
MPSYENSILIEAPIGVVFAYVNEPATFPDWVNGMIEVRNVVGTGEGLQYEWTFKMVGLLFRGQSVAVNYVQDECAAYQSIGMIESIWTNITEPSDRGTKLTIKLEYSIPTPVLGKLAEQLTLRRNKRGLDASLLNAKEALEG